MRLATIYSRATNGINAPLVTVEVHISNGLAGLNIVGLAETAVKESRDRVRSALLTANYEFPAKRITINLAPADLPKEGGRFDLPIALGMLAASGQIPPPSLANLECCGELALSGELRPVKGILPTVLAAKRAGRTLIIPAANGNEAALVKEADVKCGHHLLEICAYLKGKGELPPPALDQPLSPVSPLDLIDVKGQPHAKRGLEIAAAGRHSLLFIGPPGTGKTMLAHRLTSIMPDISESQALEVASIASVSHQGFDIANWSRIPYRAPHHTSSSVALVGGGRPPKPGEISLAHHGILFLDELPEFNRHVLECLREPLENGFITISRAAHQAMYPARFQLAAAMNPCPCGYAGTKDDNCHCSPEQVKRYRAKLSGPLLDRIDMQIEVTKLSPAMLSLIDQQQGESSATVKARVMDAQQRQITRQGKCNALLSASELAQYTQLLPSAEKILQQVMEKFNFSARVYHRLIKIARTIADLEGANEIGITHVSEALHCRCLDKARD